MYLFALSHHGVFEQRLQMLVADEPFDPSNPRLHDVEKIFRVPPGVKNPFPVGGCELPVMANHISIRPQKDQGIVKNPGIMADHLIASHADVSSSLPGGPPPKSGSPHPGSGWN
jgi:hypothetical protein